MTRLETFPDLTAREKNGLPVSRCLWQWTLLQSSSQLKTAGQSSRYPLPMQVHEGNDGRYFAGQELPIHVPGWHEAGRVLQVVAILLPRA
jgi:hypothetical protein